MSDVVNQDVNEKDSLKKVIKLHLGNEIRELLIAELQVLFETEKDLVEKIKALADSENFTIPEEIIEHMKLVDTQISILENKIKSISKDL